MHAQRGLSLIELLVSLALGLFITVAGLSLLVDHLRDSRRLLQEGRLVHDLHAAADMVARDLRRAGHWADASVGLASEGGAVASPNPYASLLSTAGTLRFRFSRDSVENHVVDSNEEFGFRLRAGAVEMLLGGGQWQTVTDSQSVVVTAFELLPTSQTIDLGRYCPDPCPPLATACPPRQTVRSYAIRLAGHVPGDPGLLHSVHTRVRVRSDAVDGSCLS